MDLGLSGKLPQSMELEYTLVLQLSGDYFIAISSTLSVDVAGRNIVLSPEEDSGESFQPIRELLGRTVETAEVNHKGALSVTFEEGSHVWVEPDPDCEAWNVSGPNGALVVSMPGGELAIWNPESNPDD